MAAQVDVHKAQAFLILAEELHFGRAAQRLHMAQPPLSRLIRRIEEELGVALFVRSTRAVALTPQGHALVEPARELVMLSQRFKEIVRTTQAGLVGRVRLGFAGSSVGYLVGELARSVRRERPGIALELLSAQFSQQGLEGLMDGSLDLVIGRWDFLPADIESRVLATEGLVVALPVGHPLAGRGSVAVEELADEPWIVLPGRSTATLPNRLALLGLEGGFVPRIVQIAPDSATMLLLVAAEMGIALTFTGVRDNVPGEGVAFATLDPSAGAVQVRLAWRRADMSPALHAVTEISRRLFPDMES